MTMFLFATSLVLSSVGLLCFIVGLWIRPIHVRPGLVLVAMFWLLLGTGMQLKAWGDELENRHAAADGANKAEAAAMELLSIARTTHSPENRDQALGLTKTAVRLLARDESERGFPLTELMALISIVLGSVTLTLALTRPDILLTRRERDAQIIKTTALAPQRGLSL